MSSIFITEPQPSQRPREDDEMRFGGLRRDQIPSRSFQVLQKMTGTESEQPQQSYTPVYYNPQQEPPPDIFEYCNHPEELDDGTVNPRYKGGNIPSRSFKMLQEMTGQAADNNELPPSVFNRGSHPQQPPPQQQKPRKTTQVVLQMGGGRPSTPGTPGACGQFGPKMFPNPQVPASQQAAEAEPKKYTGGYIPGRSFKMLQAMTGEEAPDDGTDL